MTRIGGWGTADEEVGKSVDSTAKKESWWNEVKARVMLGTSISKTRRSAVLSLRFDINESPNGVLTPKRAISTIAYSLSQTDLLHRSKISISRPQ